MPGGVAGVQPRWLPPMPIPPRLLKTRKTVMFRNSEQGCTHGVVWHTGVISDRGPRTGISVPAQLGLTFRKSENVLFR